MSRLSSFIVPIAAMLVAVAGYVVASRYGTLGIASYDRMHRLVPLCSRQDAVIGLGLAVLLGGSSVLLMGRRAWGRAIGAAGVLLLLVVLALLHWQLNRLLAVEGRWFWLDTGALLVGSMLVLGLGGRPGKRPIAWAGFGLGLAAAVGSALWTWTGTGVVRHFGPGALTTERLELSIALDYQLDLPCEVQGGQEIDYRGGRLCVPREPQVVVEAEQILAIELVRPCAASEPGVLISLDESATDRVNRLLEAHGLRVVLRNDAGEVITYTTAHGAVPAGSFVLWGTNGVWQETLRKLVGPPP